MAQKPVRLDNDLYTACMQEADRQGRSLANMVNRIIGMYFADKPVVNGKVQHDSFGVNPEKIDDGAARTQMRPMEPILSGKPERTKSNVFRDIEQVKRDTASKLEYLQDPDEQRTVSNAAEKRIAELFEELKTL